MLNESGMEGVDHSVMDTSAFFYADDGLVESINTVWLQWSFDMMIAIFDQVGLWTNVEKTSKMVYQTGPITGI